MDPTTAVGGFGIFLAGMLFGRWLQRRSVREYSTFLQQSPPIPVSPSPEAMTKARELLLNKKKIEAIKVIREDTKCGLKEAKEYVESL